MQGAAERARHRRSLVWHSAMMPMLKSPPTHDEFVDPRPRARQDPAEIDRGIAMLAAAWGARKERKP